jgi:hypothetical protein
LNDGVVTMIRTGKYAALALGVVLASTAATARAQYFGFIGPGSTVQGDIARGEGFFLFGAGYYNYNTAMANSINTDTFIRWNEYIWDVAKNENREHAIHRAERTARNLQHYNEILKRIRESPEEHDLERGDALNAELEKLLDPSISPSTFRLASVALPGETVRKIPFFYAPANSTFSMQRMSAKGKWPVGLRGEQFAPERREYELAVDDALEQQLEGKLSREAIRRVEGAVNGLREKLDKVVTPSSDKIYVEAKQFLRRLETSKDMLKLRAIEQMLAEIDKYSGANVHDLIVFMQKYNLRFGVPEIGDERELYPRLYAAFVQQRNLVTTGQPAP